MLKYFKKSILTDICLQTLHCSDISKQFDLILLVAYHWKDEILNFFVGGGEKESNFMHNSGLTILKHYYSHT